MKFQERITYQLQSGAAVPRIIAVAVIGFLIFGLIFPLVDKITGSQITKNLLNWLALSSNSSTFLTRPWTMLTYGLFEIRFWDVLFHSLWIYWIGTSLESFIGSRKIWTLFLYAIMIAGIFYLGAGIFTKSSTYQVTMIAGIMALIWASVTLIPDKTINLFFFGPIRLLYLAWAFLAFEILYSISDSHYKNMVFPVVGSLWGYFFIYALQHGHDYSKGLFKLVDRVQAVFSKPKQKSNLTIEKKQNPKPNKTTKTQKNLKTEEQLNAILDKINESGYDSLSKDEKEFLFKQSSIDA